MSTPSPLADAIIAGWQEYQENLVITVKPLTAEQLELYATPELRSVRAIAEHIVATRSGWFHWDLKEPISDELVAMDQWGRSDETIRTAEQLVHGLEATWQMIRDALARWTPEQLAAPVHLDGPGDFVVSRAWVIWHLLEHDLHHGGELAYVLGMHKIPVSLPPPPPEL
jgi:uncharacterized damage-inducible protein DinB